MTTYFLRLPKDFDNAIEAKKLADESRSEYALPFIVGYYIPQPQYKKWVPNWLIKLITKKP